MDLQACSIVDRIIRIRTTLPDSVRLIAVSKGVSGDAIRQAYAAGVRDFGENRVQEAIAKQDELQDLNDIHWHLIGHLQSNKARIALQHFDWIHSVDSLKLAQHLNHLSQDLSPPQVLLQVKLRNDPNKYGWNPVDLLQDLPQLAQCSHLQVAGLMVILPLGLSETERLSTFGQARQLQLQIQAQMREQQWQNMPMTELSMGMSDDYLQAVKAGSTMVRLGRILFGERS
uniref:Pyridoxal phosphate homeostasis protein n=1 Tax=Cyanothece sp. (strain PCC 7425 / ATCC 29141) TaxID=395961 RepID=B8HMJ6_CYAP4